MDDGMRSLVRCHIQGTLVGYRIFRAQRCNPADPNVVIHNEPLEVVKRYRKLVEDPA